MLSFARRIPLACALAVVAAGLAAAPALGQTPGDRKGPLQNRFEAMDKDGDGKVSRGEFLAGGATADMLARLDANGDGAITREEAKAAHAQKGRGGNDARGGRAMERLFDAIDADKDGRITADERARAREAHFKRLDKDGDGSLTRAELDDRRTAMREQRKERGKAQP